jgi:hypothetical protein
MKNLFLFVLLLISSYAQAARYQICVGEFAFCGASGATPTGRTITVNTPTGTAEFNEAMAECPVFTGPAVADVLGGNMQGSCDAPSANEVWSLFAPIAEAPMAPDWSVQPVVPRVFISGPEANFSNLFSFLCVKTEVVNGAQLANCFGPINESLRGGYVTSGTSMLTGSPDSVTLPVSAPLP